MLVQQSSRCSCLRARGGSPLKGKAMIHHVAATRQVASRAGVDTNFLVNLVASTACGGLAAAVTLVTAESTENEVRNGPHQAVSIATLGQSPDHRPWDLTQTHAEAHGGWFESYSSWCMSTVCSGRGSMYCCSSLHLLEDQCGSAASHISV